MIFVLIFDLNILYKNPQIYELVFPLKNPYTFKKFYFTISLNSEESQSSNIKLFYNHDGVLDSNLAIRQSFIYGQRGGLNTLGFGYKFNDFQINLKYQFNEMVYIQTFEDKKFEDWDMIFGKIKDTLYQSETGLDRTIIIEYNFDSLYRTLNLTSSGNFSIFSNPLILELGYKNFLFSAEVRSLTQSGNLIEYSAKNYILKFSPSVKVLSPSNYKWKAYVYAIPYTANPFTLKRTFDIENTNHFSFYLSYFDKSTIIRVGYSPELKINGKIIDEISYITSISNTVDSVRNGENNLITEKRGDTTEITGYATIYLFFNYNDTSYTNKYQFAYNFLSNIIFEAYNEFKINFIDLSFFFGQKPLKNLYGGFSIMHRLYGKTLSNYGYLYNKNNLFDIHSIFFNVLVPTASFLFSFGSKLSFSNSMQNTIKNVLKNYLISFEENNKFTFSLNLQIIYLK